MKQKQFKPLKQLKFLYLFIFVLTFVLVALTHLFPQPFFMPLRFPHYLEMMKPFFGVSWPMSFEIYHYVLYALIMIAILNALGVIFYPKLNKIVFVSSLSGIFLISSMVLFFFFQFIKINPSTAIIYGLYSVVLLIVDILTFKLTQQKEA